MAIREITQTNFRKAKILLKRFAGKAQPFWAAFIEVLEKQRLIDNLILFEIKRISWHARRSVNQRYGDTTGMSSVPKTVCVAYGNLGRIAR